MLCGDRESLRKAGIKLWTYTGAQHTVGFLFCPLLLLHIGLLCCLWCFYFWEHGIEKDPDPLPQCIAGNSKHTQTKNSPQPPSYLPLILSLPNCGCSHPLFTSWGTEGENTAMALAVNRPPDLPFKMSLLPEDTRTVGGTLSPLHFAFISLPLCLSILLSFLLFLTLLLIL